MGPWGELIFAPEVRHTIQRLLLPLRLLFCQIFSILFKTPAHANENSKG